MLGHDRRQAGLLEHYWMLLRGNRRATPPAGLDPQIADLAARLERTLAPPAPTSAYAEQMRRRLTAQATRLAAGEAIDLPTRPSTTRPNEARSMLPTHPQPRERQPMQPTGDERAETGRSPGAPTPLPRKHWYSEYGKLAAAIAIFVVVGVVLVLLLRDDDDQQTAQPLPTATPAAVASPTAAPTQAAVPTPTVPAIAPTAVPPTATAPEPQPFTFSARIDALPDGSDYLSIARMTWRAFGGTDENLVTNAATLTYQDIGAESCFGPGAIMTIVHADGTTEPLSSDIAAPSVIQQGDGYVSPSTTGLNCKNNTAASSTSLWLSIHRGGEAGIQDAALLPGGVSYEVLAHGPADDLPSGAVNLTLQRVILAAGEQLPQSDLQTLVFVESGTLQLSNAIGDETITRGVDGSGTSLTPGSEADLAPSDGVSLPPTSSAELRNAGDTPTTVLVATVEPED